MTDDARRGAYPFDAYFQDASETHAGWESVVLQFTSSEPGELVRQTHDSLVRLLESSNDTELAERLFGPVPLTSYSPRPENLMARAWVEEIVFLLAGVAPRNMNSMFESGVARLRSLVQCSPAKRTCSLAREIFADFASESGSPMTFPTSSASCSLNQKPTRFPSRTGALRGRRLPSIQNVVRRFETAG